MSVGLTQTTLVQGNGEAPAKDADRTKEYLGGGFRSPLRGGYASVASSALDAEECGGSQLWELMMMDPFVAASVRVAIAGILADGVEPGSAICDDDDDDASPAQKARAEEIRRFVAVAQRRMKTPLVGSLRQIIRCGMVHGTGLGENVYDEITSGQYKGKMGLDRVKPKSIDAWGFRVDNAMNVLGIQGWSSAFPGGVTGPRVLPRDKFTILAWDQQDGNPGGRSALREAQPAWNMRVQAFPLYWDFLDLFANPMIAGEAGLKDQPEIERDDDGNPIPGGALIQPVDQLYEALVRVAIGKVIAVPNGGKVWLLQPQGDGGAFTTGLDLLAREIVYGILGSARVIMEAERSSKKDGEVVQDEFGVMLRMWKTNVRECVRRDVYRPLVEINFGEDDAAEFTPIPAMGETEHQDFSRNAGAVARLYAAGVLDERDRPKIVRFLFGPNYKAPMGPPQPVQKPGSGVNPADPNAHPAKESANPPSPANGRAA